jgi:hypothetical protein
MDTSPYQYYDQQHYDYNWNFARGIAPGLQLQPPGSMTPVTPRPPRIIRGVSHTPQQQQQSDQQQQQLDHQQRCSSIWISSSSNWIISLVNLAGPSNNLQTMDTRSRHGFCNMEYQRPMPALLSPMDLPHMQTLI